MDESKLTERHVQAIWYDRDLRPANLMTASGECVRVVHPGEWNLISGPDFRGAILEIGETHRRLVGDVEIHLSPSDWDAHGHGADPAYRNVIAHVTWRGGIAPPSLPNGAVSIWLGRYLSSDVGFSPDSIDPAVYPFGKRSADDRPCRRRSAQGPHESCRILAHAGRWRLKVKAGRFASLLKNADRRQVFYAEVMGALGYGRNSAGFRAVAEAVPYSVVRDEPDNASSAFMTVASFIEWSRDRVRPKNSPEARLQEAARLFTETDAFSLMRVNDMSQGSCRRMVDVLTEGRHIGKGRAAAIVANIVVPFALALGNVRDPPDWLPPEDICAPVRRVAHRMFGSDHNPSAWYATNGLLIQGLIQMDREWCARLYPSCSECDVKKV